MTIEDSIKSARKSRLRTIRELLEENVYEDFATLARKIDRALLPATYGDGVGVGEIPPAKGV